MYPQHSSFGHQWFTCIRVWRLVGSGCGLL